MDKLQWRLIAKHGLAGARILRALADELDNLRRFAVGSNPAKLARRDAQGVGIHEPVTPAPDCRNCVRRSTRP